jgi:hypothetical protein
VECMTTTAPERRSTMRSYLPLRPRRIVMDELSTFAVALRSSRAASKDARSGEIAAAKRGRKCSLKGVDRSTTLRLVDHVPGVWVGTDRAAQGKSPLSCMITCIKSDDERPRHERFLKIDVLTTSFVSGQVKGSLDCWLGRCGTMPR